MSYFQKMVIDGVEFEYIDGRVCLSPSFNINNHHHRSALKEALELRALMEVFCHAVEHGEDFRHTLQNTNHDIVSDLVATIGNQKAFGDIYPDDLQTFIAAIEAYWASIQLKEPRPGWVYLLRHEGRDNIYKIGRSQNPDDRLATFGVKLPFQVEYEHLIECDDMVSLEGKLHQTFNHKRINGEWFQLDDLDVAYIKSIGGAT